MIELVLPVLVPLGLGIVALLLRRGSGWLAVSGAAVSLVASFRVLVGTGPGEVSVYAMGGWRPPFGIVFVGDGLSLLLVVMASFVFLAVLLGGTGEGRVFNGLVLFVLAGVNGSFLTGDLFNLFVWFEVMLISSYVLVAYGGGWSSVASLRYLVMNLVGSSVMLMGIGGVYRATGTLNMAQIGSVAGGSDSAVLVASALLLFLAFALKAGAVPVHFWVAEVYAEAATPVAAVLAGAVKKVGVYGVIRLAFVVLPVASGRVLELALVLGAASMLYGGVLAVSQRNLDRLLANSSIAQVGFMLFAVGLGSRVGLTAALLVVLGHGLAKPLLFHVSGELRRGFGSPEVAAMGGGLGQARFLAFAFLVGGFSLVGIPPMLGFFGKLFLLRAALEPAWLLVVVAGSILTLLYVSRVWTEAFWGGRKEFSGGVNRGYVPVVLLAAALLAAGIGFEGVWTLVERGVDTAMRPELYYDGVLGVAE